MATSISIKFLGVRAIHANPSRGNETTGGNTGCIQIHDGTTKIFINAGFGINSVGGEITSEAKQRSGPPEVNILFSDFLWESTLGLASFLPMHLKSSTINIITAGEKKVAFDALNDAASKYFTPFDGLESLPAKKKIIEAQTPVIIGRWSIQGLLLPNALTPDGAAVWRLNHADGHSIGVVMLCETSHDAIAKGAEFLNECDTLICSASNVHSPHITSQNRLGFDDALTLAVASNSQSLILSQFHPAMTDFQLQQELLLLHKKLDQLKSRGAAKSLSIRLAHELEPIVLASASGHKIAV